MPKTLLSTEPYKGVRDFYPEEMALQRYIFGIMRRVVESYGYQAYEASILEDRALYEAKSGEEIVAAQTYSFEDRGGRQVTLRPEMTPTVARMIARRRQQLIFPLRWYSIANMFRYERPQRGRLREHWQLNVDLFGLAGLEADAELLCLSADIMKTFGAPSKSFEIRISHRALLNQLVCDILKCDKAQAYALCKLIDRMNKMKRTAFEVQLQNVIPDKKKQSLLKGFLDNKNLPVELRSTEAFQDVMTLRQSLEDRGLDSIVFDPTLVRGFDYYTGIVFEVYDRHPQNNRSLFGGGRYENLVALFGVESVTGVGFGMGDVTIRDFLETHNLLPPYAPALDICLCCFESAQHAFAQRLAQDLRQQGLRVLVDMSGKKIAAQIKWADRQSIPYVICLGEDEITTETFRMKELKTGREHILKRGDIASCTVTSNIERSK